MEVEKIKMNIQLSEHFTYKKLIKFTLPTIIMMIFTSIYGVVDGIFVSNFVGSDAFAGVNLIMPALMILGSVGFMFRYRWKCYCIKNNWRRRKGKSAKIFFNAYLSYSNIRYNFNYYWIYIYKTDFCFIRCKRRNDKCLRNLWKNITYSISIVSFAECFSKFFSCS